MKRSIWNYLIDVGLALSFLGVFATGIFKLPEVLRFLGPPGEPRRRAGAGSACPCGRSVLGMSASFPL